MEKLSLIHHTSPIFSQKHDITTIRQGYKDINGTSIVLYRKVNDLEQKQAIQNTIHSQLNKFYQLHKQLVIIHHIDHEISYGYYRLIISTLHQYIHAYIGTYYKIFTLKLRVFLSGSLTIEIHQNSL